MRRPRQETDGARSAALAGNPARLPGGDVTGVALAGSTALVRALSLRLSGMQNGIAFSALVVVVPLLLFVRLPSVWTLIIIGGGGLAAAIALNRAALKHTATYRHSSLPIALPLTR